MRPTARRRTNWSMVDDRCSGGKMTETDLLRCVHCHAQIPIDPFHSRPLIRCNSCDAYVCDNGRCNAKCNGSFNRVLDTLQEKLSRQILF